MAANSGAQLTGEITVKYKTHHAVLTPKVKVGSFYGLLLDISYPGNGFVFLISDTKRAYVISSL